MDVVAIGVSTGGPNALSALLPELPGDLPVPVVIVQHMPPVFTKLLAERLASQSALQVREAAAGDDVRPGQVYVAPGNYHMMVMRGGQQAHRNSIKPHPRIPVAPRSMSSFGRSSPRTAQLPWE